MNAQYTLDLFAPEQAESAHAELLEAYDAWRAAAKAASRLKRPSTLQVYDDMWGAFSAWCLAQSPQVTLRRLREIDLEHFLNSREGSSAGSVTPRHAWRLIRLVDRVLARYAMVRGAPKNEAAADYMRRTEDISRANSQERPAIDYLDAVQTRRLVAYLSEFRPGAVNRRRLSGWQELRNLAAVALHLGAGVTPGDLRDLPADAPAVAGGRWKDVPWKLKVPGNGNRESRETPIAPWAGHLLAYWQTVRAESVVPSFESANKRRGDDTGTARSSAPNFLFPGRSGQQWGKAAHYQAVQAVMVAAGIDDPDSGSGGAFRLRHTFALRQLRHNRPVQDVARWMGISKLEEMDRYQRIIKSYEEPV